ncbi:MAG: lipopolysaccharide biosynthesis protein [Bacteroides oleiciplenus]|nr:MAG: lipopolysaccharide biosynthesis protein [Bacteroides oleiciplenus]
MSNDINSARVIAFYLPQFHPVPENDEWWGKGFTEWTNVGKARSLFPGHYQPKVPADLGYYDLRVSETRKAQADMAREYGIEGFCYWHYWFGNGKRLLERPFNEVLASGEPDFPFCLAWANESWRGYYHGIKAKETLIDQLYPGEEDYIAHFNAVLPAFKDKRYITVDGKPLFMIYHPFDNQMEINTFIKLWRELAVQNGLEGIFFVGQTYHLDDEKADLEDMGFDAINVVRLFDYERKQRSLYRRARRWHNWLGLPWIVSYEKVSRFFVADEESDEKIIPTIIPNWDHSPRSGKQGLVLHRSEPEYFGRHMKDVMACLGKKTLEHRLAFVKSWNEWAEGNYLEPDLRYGRSYLEVIKECVVKECRDV